MNVKDCLGKKVVYSPNEFSNILNEGVVESINNTVVKIGGLWYEVDRVKIKAVLPDDVTTEGGSNREQVIEG